MSSVVTDLENALQQMQGAKPPGVSGSKIALITDLSVNNVQSESVIIQKLYTHFKKCPGTHKLGPLYVVDSIARRYLEYAKKNHQEVSGSAPDGTFAAGVFRITNLLPPLMNDILQHAPPDENKDKIEKLFAIWERSSTFPPEVLTDIKAKMHASPMFQAQNQPSSSTPPGSPPQYLRMQTSFAQNQTTPRQNSLSQAPPVAAAPQSNGVASMLQAIAQMAKQNQNAATPPPPPVATEPRPTIAASTPQYNIPAATQSNGYPAVSHPASLPPSTLSQAAMSMPYTSTPPNANNNALQALAGQLNGYSMFQQNQPQTQPTYPQFSAPQQQQQQPQNQMEQIALLQLLLQQPGLSQMAAPQLAPALQGLLAAQQNGQLGNNGDSSQFWSQMGSNMIQPQDPRAGDSNRTDAYGDERRGRGYSPPPRSPPRYSGGRRGRSRSPTPERFDRDTRSPPNFRRRSPVYGEYEGNETGGRGGSSDGRGDGRNRGGKSRGRRGSPRRRDRSPSARFSSAKGPQASPEIPNRELSLPKVPKNVTFDSTIGPNSVRVLSRTLFVGGVTINEDDLRQLFENFGLVQSCIVNQDKRHAFIKMLTRDDAVKAKSGMETYRTDNMTLRTRWGVGFGPRDCSDYQTGVSVIPIDRLTEADQRWMVSAEYGGTGGQPLKGGMCVEEPDIEIGQGVSSKAISKRFPTDSGGNKGPRSSQEHSGPTHRGGGGKRKDQEHTKNADSNQRAVQGTPGGRDNVGVAPPTPGFGAGFPFTMPMIPPGMPPGFSYPGFPGAPTG